MRAPALHDIDAVVVLRLNLSMIARRDPFILLFAASEPTARLDWQDDRVTSEDPLPFAVGVHREASDQTRITEVGRETSDDN